MDPGFPGNTKRLGIFFTSKALIGENSGIIRFPDISHANVERDFLRP